MRTHVFESRVLQLPELLLFLDVEIEAMPALLPVCQRRFARTELDAHLLGVSPDSVQPGPEIGQFDVQAGDQRPVTPDLGIDALQSGTSSGKFLPTGVPVIHGYGRLSAPDGQFHPVLNSSWPVQP